MTVSVDSPETRAAAGVVESTPVGCAGGASACSCSAETRGVPAGNGKAHAAVANTPIAREDFYQTEQKKIYIPYMCDHCYAMAAAMRANNLPAEVLKPTTEETRELGLRVCKGRECLPCLTTTGDILQRADADDFDARQSAVFMPTTSGSCRFGCYNVLQRDILHDVGMSDLEFLSPSAGNSYAGLGEDPQSVRLLIWQGAVACDLLYKLLHTFRPYELHRGETDEVYERCLERVVVATDAGGGRELVEAMRWTARQFERLPVDMRERRPLIGMVGEIYLRFNRYVNLDLVRQVEEAGGEVQIAPVIEWLYYTNWAYKRDSRIFGMPKKFVKTVLTDEYQKYLERRLLQPVEHLLRHPHDSSIQELMDNLTPYYHSALHSEAILSMGTSIDYARRGFCGILNVLPFSCMPGTITAGLAPCIRADLDNIPWLDVSYDAQKGTNLKTRLEAFMYQATQFYRRTQGAGVAVRG